MIDRLLERAAYHESGHCASAIIYSIPIVRVSITDNNPHVRRGHYRSPRGLGLETMCVFCLAGPAAEAHYVGPITDHSDRVDIADARRYLARDHSLFEVEAEIARFRAAAERLVVTEQQRIRRIASALLKFGTLSGEDIFELNQT